MGLKPRKTKSGQKVYGTYKFENGSIAFRKSDKSDKFAIVFTRCNNSQTSFGSIDESEIETHYNLISAFDNLSESPAQFESNLKNINSKDGEFALYGLSRTQFFNLIKLV